MLRTRSCRRFAAGLLLLASAAWAGQQTSTPTQQPPPNPPPAAKAKPHARVIQDLSGFELTDPAKLNQQTMVVGGTRGFASGSAPPQALAPRLGKLYASTAIFEWSYSGPPGKTTFVLLTEEGKEALRAEVEPAQRRYSLSNVPLEPGKTYRWHIEIRLGEGQSLKSEPAAFIVDSGEERRSIEESLSRVRVKNSCKAGLARARIFTEHRVWYDSVAAYSDLIARCPSRINYYEERGMIYAQIPATQYLAEADFAKADGMESRKSPS
jgi:hypothetical protein